MDNILDLAINLFDEVETVHQMRESFRFDTWKRNAEDFMREEEYLYERICRAVDEFDGENFRMLAALFKLYSLNVAMHYNRWLETCHIDFMRMPSDKKDIHDRLSAFRHDGYEFDRIVYNRR